MSDNNIQEQSLPWTGERYLPEVQGSIELEHLHRYLFAKQFTLGKRILDIASGEGYGSALLAQNAISVIGVDISPEAVAHANAKYQTDNLEYKLGSCSAIPLADHSIDVVVSFETIEHHDEHDAMMREIKRVLVPSGLLVISSPDKLEYSDRPSYDNPYHVKELYRDEFKSLLENCFKNYSMAGQRVIYGSAIFEEDNFSKLRSYDLKDKSLQAAPGISRAIYLVAVASDAEVPMFESGILEQQISESDAVMENTKQLANLHQNISKRDQQIEAYHLQAEQFENLLATANTQIISLNQVIAERDVKITLLNHALAERDVKITLLNHALAERDEQLANLVDEQKLILKSASWKITRPLRFLKRLMSINLFMTNS